MKEITCCSRFEKGTVVISIDDGQSDDFRLYENILSKHKLSATFNIISSVIGEEKHLTKEQLVIMHSDPLMEIAAHGHTHKNDDEDISRGIAALNDWLDISESTIGFASPGCKMNNQFIEENTERLKSLGLLYVRAGMSSKANKRHFELQSKLKELGESDYVIMNIPQLTYSFNSMCVHSAGVYHDTTVAELIKLVDLAEEESACIVFMFHHTRKKSEDYYDSVWNFDYDKFEEFAEYLSKRREEGVINVLTNRQAFLIGANRD